jgi:hypothetical protein
MANEANEASFSLSLDGETTGEKWVGDFKAKKRLSHRDQLRKDQVRRDLLGPQGNTPTERAMSTAMILSELRVRLVDAPKWWQAMGEGLDLEDDNVIGTLYDEVMKIEREAGESKKKKAADALTEMRKEAAEKKDE